MHRIALALVAACLAVPALAQPSETASQEVRLDLDGDGRLDLARLVETGAGDTELHIHLGMGAATPDAARKPDIIKSGIASNRFVGLDVRRDRALVVTSSCGGCTQSVDTRLTILHRGGRLVVAGLDVDWEFRDGAGRCSINFLTGRGAITPLPDGRPRPIRKKLAPVPLAAWDVEVGQDLCFPTR